MTDWEPVIGLEIHVQLKTETKMFCRCRNGFGGEPNTQTCPVCLAFPGALPVPNRRAIEETIKLGHALGSEIAERAIFHRKHYFYPDNPKAYQISQYDEPLCIGGHLDVPTEDGDIRVGIVRAHLEEDAAKNVHVAASGRIHGATATLVDFNRGGTPLVEIVTQPEIHSAELAKRFLQLLRQTVVELGISDAELEKGTMRFDVNVSVRPEGSNELRTRTELKNMNSFNFAAKGIEREVARQIGIYKAGGQVEQETLHFDPANEDSPPLRSKEEADDYRYLPEPDLVPVHPPADLVARLASEIGELPPARIGRIARTLSFYDAEVLVTSGLDRLWSALVDEDVDPKEAANVLANDFAASGGDPSAVDPAKFAVLIKARRDIPREAFTLGVASTTSESFSPIDFTKETVVSDTAELDPVIDAVIAANPGQVAAYRGGKEGLLGFLVGQVMKATGGKADPRVVNERLREKLGSLSIMEKRYLFTPGPTPVPPEVLAAMAEPIVHHRGPDFRLVYERCLSRLQEVFRTRSQVLLFAASGTGAMDSAVSNLATPGQRVAVVTAGAFGERWVAICERYGVDVQRIAYEWGEVPVPDEVGSAVAESGARIVFCTQSETSTGVVSDVQALKAAVGDAVLVVDGISSLGAVPLETDAWGIDVVLSGSQKALMCPPGLAMATVADHLWETLPSSRTFYFDWRATRKAQEAFDAAFTPAVSLIRGLDVALGMLLGAGLDAAFERHVRLGRATRAGMKAMGLELFSPDDDSSSVVTAVRCPDGVDGTELLRHLRDRHGVTLAPGQGGLKGKIFRIGHIGWFDVFDIAAAIAAVELSLVELGADIDRGVAVTRAFEAYEPRVSVA